MHPGAEYTMKKQIMPEDLSKRRSKYPPSPSVGTGYPQYIIVGEYPENILFVLRAFFNMPFCAIQAVAEIIRSGLNLLLTDCSERQYGARGSMQFHCPFKTFRNRPAADSKMIFRKGNPEYIARYIFPFHFQPVPG